MPVQTMGKVQNNDFDLPQPLWVPTTATIQKYSLWDYYSFPLRQVPEQDAPVDYLRRAYNFLFNEEFRDQAIQKKVHWSNETILHRNWEKDYFTIARPSQQLGTEPALPYGTELSALWSASGKPNDRFGNPFIPLSLFPTVNGLDPLSPQAGPVATTVNSANDGALFPPGFKTGYQGNPSAPNVTGYPGIPLSTFNNNTVSMGGIQLFNVADLRLLFAVQGFLERMMRAGSRYIEFIKSMFGTSPRDERLNRPEYIGGTRSPVIISEVLQTSETQNTAQANMAGHGLSASSTRIGSYRVQEHGLIITLLSIMPRTSYQDGISRKWTRRTNYEYQNPIFNHLSEQAVLKREVYAGTDSNENGKVFGFQPIYDELRYLPSHVAGAMRKVQGQTQLSYWNLVRELPSNVELNSDFIQCKPRTDIFAVTNYPGCIVSYGSHVRAVRNIPAISKPGLIDHF